MGIELPPELTGVAAQAGVEWPEADEDAMAKQAQAWRDTAKSMSTLATDADTTARSALSSVSGDTATAASAGWKTFVEPDTGHLTSIVKDANAAADRLEHAADQIGTAKVEIVRNLVNLAQNQDAAHAAAQAGHPTALAGLDTAVRGTAANVAHIQSQLVSAVQPTSGVDMAAVQNPVNANPGHHLLPGVTTDATTLVTHPEDLLRPGGAVAADQALHGVATGSVADTLHHTGNATGHGGPVDQALRGVGNLAQQTTSGAADILHHTSDAVSTVPGDVVHDLPGTAADVVNQTLPGHPGDVIHDLPGTTAGVVNQALPGHPGDAIHDLPGTAADAVHDLPGTAADVVNHTVPGHPGDATPGHPGDILPGDPEVTGPVPSHDIHFDAPTPPTGQTVQAGFVGGLEPSAAAAPTNLPPAAPPLNPAAPAPAFGGNPGFSGTPVAPPVGAPPVPAAPVAAPPPPRAAASFAPAPVIPADPAPRKPIAGPPGAPPPAKGEGNEVLAAFWIHMFPIGHLPVASYRPARQLPPPPPELDYAAGLRFEPADHPNFNEIDPAPRLAELTAAAAPQDQELQHYTPTPGAGYPPAPPSHPAEAVAAGYAPAPNEPAYAPHEPVQAQATPSQDPAAEAKTVPSMRPVTPSAGLTADHPTVQALLDNHDPLGGGNERDWDRRYLVRLGSVTAHGISPEGLEYNWPTSEQYPEGGSAAGEPETLQEGTVIDRFGDPHGRVFAADGTPFAQRSLPPAHKDLGYRRYQVTKPLPVWRAVSAAWFGQPGGGVRYRTTHSAAELVALGYLEEIA
jgi:hypothetical protein